MDFYVAQESQASLYCTCAAIHLQQIKKLHWGWYSRMVETYCTVFYHFSTCV